MNKEEAANFLGCSVRTLQRYVENGKIPCQHQRSPKGIVTFFDPADLEKFKADMTTMMMGDNRAVTPVIQVDPGASGAVPMPVLSPSHSAKFAAHYEPVPTIPPEMFNRMTAALEAIAASQPQPAIGDGSPTEEPEEKKAILPPSELAFKLMLDLDEVSALTGLAKGWLYQQIKEGKFPVVNPTKKKFMVKRASLDQFIEALK